MQPRLNGMVGVTHAKLEPEHFLQREGGFFLLLARGLLLITPTGLTGMANPSDQFYYCWGVRSALGGEET
jgi:hypothetical protein